MALVNATGDPLRRVLRFDGVVTVRDETGTEYVEADDGSYVTVVDSYRYQTNTGTTE